jgi:uridylate kinase
MSSAKYRRILLKVSGEMLAGEQGYGIQPSVLEGLAAEIAEVVKLDAEVAVVIGGGNIFRGISGAFTAVMKGEGRFTTVIEQTP